MVCVVIIAAKRVCVCVWHVTFPSCFSLNEIVVSIKSVWSVHGVCVCAAPIHEHIRALVCPLELDCMHIYIDSSDWMQFIEIKSNVDSALHTRDVDNSMRSVHSLRPMYSVEIMKN